MKLCLLHFRLRDKPQTRHPRVAGVAFDVTNNDSLRFLLL